MDGDGKTDTEVRDPQAETISAKSASDLVSDSASGSVSNSEKPNKNRKIKYVILSIVTLVLILSVAAVAFIIINKPQNDESQNESEQEFVSEFDAKVTETHETIWQKFQEDGDVDSLVANYKTAIDAAKNENDYLMANTLISDRTFDLFYSGHCEQAIETLKNEDINMFTPEDLATFYSGAIGMSLECGDNDSYELWKAAYGEILPKLEEITRLEGTE